MKRTPLKRKTPLRAKRKPSRSQAARELMELPILCVVCRATPVPGHPRHGNRKGFSSSYTVREASLPTFPRALR